VEEKGPSVADLTGTHNYQLDAKGRMSLPARFREALADGGFVTLGQDGCLYVFPLSEWTRMREEVKTNLLADPAGRHYERMFASSAERIALDNQGRFSVPQRLRTRAGIGREVVVIGVLERMEIWDRTAWERYEEAHAGAYQSGALLPAGGRHE
jgi:MraZ protein